MKYFLLYPIKRYDVQIFHMLSFYLTLHYTSNSNLKLNWKIRTNQLLQCDPKEYNDGNLYASSLEISR